MIAAATMYEVSTQVIWSCVADRLPCMRGSATLAMVLSSACRIDASMIVTVIMPRWLEASTVATLDGPALTIQFLIFDASAARQLGGSIARWRRCGTRSAKES